MICEKCGADTPAPLENCIFCSTPLPVSPPIHASPVESRSEFPTIQPVPVPASKSEGPLHPGDVLGRYRIEKMLGSGGMGHVYKAWDEELSEAVALKVIRSEYAANSEAAVRFRRELSLARQVTHKNVVRIYDLGEINGIKYLSMPFIDGLDLATMMKNGKLPLTLALSVARQVAAGLAAAHEAGVVHRDLKPANIMVSKAGVAILMDFGLARSAEATAYTAAGAVLGTLEYMSPEQAQGQTATNRSDIYTLGLIYYELFTGERPFRGETPMSRLAERVNKPAPNPRTHHPDIPVRVAAIIQRCIERDPALRYASATEIEADLDPARASDEAPVSKPSSTTGAQTSDEFVTGTILAGRYQILRRLGSGAMGMVYQAFDRELTRVVAVKTILPELAANPAILKRFKQEVRLAQKINHKNIVRIFDMGEDGRIKFITMDFIEGVDLNEVLVKRGKLPAPEAVGIIRQVCQALEAAHAEGVTHRDLKPHNIRVQPDGQVVVMDFGIARSQQSQTGTTTDAIVGTPEYMSPEQARSEEVDARSDIFSLGLIFYELLTGTLPFRADTAIATVFKRTQERAVPPAEVDPSIPKGANNIVVKCLETDRERRYQNVGGILADLETFDPSQKVGAATQVKVRLKKLSRYRNWAVACVALVLALAGGFMLRSRFLPGTPATHAPVTVLVSDFSNHTGDAVFDGTLEPVVKLALEGAAFINVYDRTRMRADLGLPPISGRLDESAARKIAVGQGLGVVIAASLDLRGTGYTLSMKATEAVTGKTIRTAEATAANKDQVLFTATKLATAVRTALGDDTSDSAQRFAMESLSATSLEAIHEYAAAMDAVSNARYEEALGSFSKALDLDQNFGLAYAGMAVASRALGQQQDAEKHIKLAISRLDRMTERERYRTRGFYYALAGDRQKCVDEYTSLISRFPSDAAAHNNLAFCWSDLRNMPKALEQVRQAAAILPKRTTYQLNISLFASYGTDFQTGERQARKAQELDSSSRFGFIALAFSQMGQGQLSQAAATYKELETLSKLGASDARSGLADIALYEGRFADAIRILEQGAAVDLAAKYPDRAAEKFAALAYTRLLQGQKGPAVTAAERALTSSTIVKIRFLAGRIFAAAGKAARAQALADDLAMEFQTESQVYAKLIEGEIARTSGDPRKAVKAFTEANSMLDTWIGHFDLGRAYLEAGLFNEADSEFERCNNRRGEALSLFLDQTPTYGYFPIIYYYVGRVREWQKSPGFADSYRTYLSIRGKAGEDPLLVEVRKRIGS